MFDDLKIENNNASLFEEKPAIDPAVLDEIVKAGVLYGRKKSKTHPRMHRFIFTTRNGIEIIDTLQTLELIQKASDFLRNVVQGGGMILWVGTTPAAKEAVQASAKKFNHPYVTERWLGGTLTNFKTINQRIQYYIKLKSERDAGKLEKYTKKERSDFDKEILRLTALFNGLETLTKLPDVLVVVGATSHSTVIREARRMKIPVVAILSTDADSDLVDYPIPANDRARPSIEWLLAKFESAVHEGKKSVVTVEPQK